jgi:hypothetical protein
MACLLESNWPSLLRKSRVIQEVAVARKVDAFYGGKYLDWKMLTSVMATFSGADMMQKLWANQPFEHQYPTDPASMAVMGCENAAFMNLVQKDFASNDRPSLMSLFMSCQSWKAMDPKDKVFAVLALADPSSHGSIAARTPLFARNCVLGEGVQCDNHH